MQSVQIRFRPTPVERAEWRRGGPILLIDPDPASRDIGSLLMRYFGYEVQAAATLQEGRHLARTTRPSAVICELMPDTAGNRTIVEVLKRDPATASVPVLVLSSYVLPADRERALAGGAAVFLTKPCDGEALRSTLSEIVGEPRGKRERR